MVVLVSPPLPAVGQLGQGGSAVTASHQPDQVSAWPSGKRRDLARSISASLSRAITGPVSLAAPVK